MPPQYSFIETESSLSKPGSNFSRLPLEDGNPWKIALVSINLERKLVDVIGDRTAKVITSEFGYQTVGDFLHHYPRRYVKRGELTNIAELREGEEATVLAKVHSVKSRRMQNRKNTIVEVIIVDNQRNKMSLTFFNQAWREREMRVGRQGLFAGKIGTFKGQCQLAHPDLEWLPEIGRAHV